MNDVYDFYDDEQIFGVNDWERYKRGEQPKGWLEARKNLLVARCRAQSENLGEVLVSADAATVERFKEPL